jgi:hypothetical protein
MQSLAAVRDELAGLLRTAQGLRGHAYMPDPGALHFPAAVVMDAVPSYNTTFGANVTTVRFRIALSVGGQVTRATQERLDGYHTFDDLSVEAVDVVGFEDVAEMGFYGAMLTVRVDITTEQP